MSSCKDCLHYSVCQYRRGREMLPTSNQCNDFANRSEWVHLPCKVDDKLYRIVDDLGKSKTHYKIQKYTVSGLSIVVNVKDPYNSFEGYRIGRDLFLDRKKARKLLKEMNGAVFT